MPTPSPLDLLSLAALDGQSQSQAGQDARRSTTSFQYPLETTTTVINIDNPQPVLAAPAPLLPLPVVAAAAPASANNPKVAGVKRKASSTSSTPASSSMNLPTLHTGNAHLPRSLASILSSPPPAPPTPLPEDSGLIRCICIFDDDDGFSIQCERCFAWQHGLCVNITPDAVPETYICPMCAPAVAAISGSPRKRGHQQQSAPVGLTRQDRERATELQRLRKEAEARLRRQRMDMGLPPSSSDGQFGNLAQQGLDEEYELLAQARGLAFQQSQRQLYQPSPPHPQQSQRQSSTGGGNNNRNRSNSQAYRLGAPDQYGQGSPASTSAALAAPFPMAPATHGGGGSRRSKSNSPANPLFPHGKAAQQAMPSPGSIASGSGGLDQHHILTGGTGQTTVLSPASASLLLPGQQQPQQTQSHSQAFPQSQAAGTASSNAAKRRRGNASNSVAPAGMESEHGSPGTMPAPNRDKENGTAAVPGPGTGGSQPRKRKSATAGGTTGSVGVGPARANADAGAGDSGRGVLQPSQTGALPLPAGVQRQGPANAKEPGGSTSRPGPAARARMLAAAAGSSAALAPSLQASAPKSTGLAADKSSTAPAGSLSRILNGEPTLPSVTEPLAPSTVLQAQAPSAQNTAGSGTATPIAQSRESLAYSSGDDDDGYSADERYEPWMFEYTPITRLRWSADARPSWAPSPRSLAADATKRKAQALVDAFVADELQNLAASGPTTEKEAETVPMEKERDTLASNHPLPTRPSLLSGLSSASFKGNHLSLALALSNNGTRNGSPVPSSGSSTPAYSSSGVASALSAPLTPVILPRTSLAACQADLPKFNVRPLATSSLSLAPPACTPFSGPTSVVPSLMNPYPRPTIHGAFTSSSHTSGSLISLMVGQVLSGDEYRADPINQWAELGTFKNHTRAIGQPWDLVLDQRKWADETRFVRQGCHPNVFVRPVILRKSREGANGEESGRHGKKSGKRAKKPAAALRKADDAGQEWELHFGLYALQDISKREELVLPYDWADDHVVHSLHTLLFSPSLVFPQLPANMHSRGTDSSSSSEDDGIPSTSSYPVMSSAQKHAIAHATKHLFRLSRLANSACLTLLGTTVCACEKRRDCAIAWLWKLGSYTDRSSSSNRKINRAAATAAAAASGGMTNMAVRLQDFDLKGLKIACSTALASEEKEGAYSGTTRSSRKTAKKRRADIGALVGLARGWTQFEHLGQDEEMGEAKAADEAEPEAAESDHDVAVVQDHVQEVHGSRQPTSAAAERPAKIDLPDLEAPTEEVDMLVPTPTSSNAKQIPQQARESFDFSSNIPPILRTLMAEKAEQARSKPSMLSGSSKRSPDPEPKEELDRASDSDLTEPLPSGGEDDDDTLMDLDDVVEDQSGNQQGQTQKDNRPAKLDETSTIQHNKAKAHSDTAKASKVQIAGATRDEGKKEPKKSKKSIAKAAKASVANEAESEPKGASSARKKKPVKVRQRRQILDDDDDEEDVQPSKLKSRSPSPSKVDAATVAVVEGPSLESLFDARLPSPSPVQAAQVPQTEGQASGVQGSYFPATRPSPKPKDAAPISPASDPPVGQQNPAPADLHASAPPVAVSDAPDAPKPLPPPQIRKLSFRDYKQRSAVFQPSGPVGSAISEEPMSAASALDETKEDSVSPGTARASLASPRGGDKVEMIQTESPSVTQVGEIEEALQPARAMSLSPPAPAPPPPPPPPRARLSFKAYRERLSAGSGGLITPPSTSTVLSMDTDAPTLTPKTTVPLTITEEPADVSEHQVVASSTAPQQVPSPFLSATKPSDDHVPATDLEPIKDASTASSLPASKSDSSGHESGVSTETARREESNNEPHTLQGSSLQLTDVRRLAAPKSPEKVGDEKEEGEVVSEPMLEPGEVKPLVPQASAQPELIRIQRTLTKESAHTQPSYAVSQEGYVQPSPALKTTPLRQDSFSPAPRTIEPRELTSSPRPSTPPPRVSAPTKHGETVALPAGIPTGPAGSPPNRSSALHGPSSSPPSGPSALLKGLQPPTGPRNPVAPPPPPLPWGRGRGRGREVGGLGGAPMGGSSYRPGLPPSGPRADREAPPPSGPRGFRGGRAGFPGRGGRGRGFSAGPRDSGWNTPRGRGSRGGWEGRG